MSDIAQAKKDYAAAVEALTALEAGLQFSVLLPVTAEVSQRKLNQDELKNWLADLSSETEGWLQYPSSLAVLPENMSKLPSQLPLQAELFVQGKSQALRYLGHYQWQVCSVELQETTPESATYLAEIVEHLADRPQLGRLCYQKLWQLQPASSPKLALSCFTGFKGGQA